MDRSPALPARHSRISASAMGAGFVCLFLIGVFGLARPWRYDPIQWDVKSYYAYLPAALIHHDLTLGYLDPIPPGERRVSPMRTTEGRLVLKTTMGLALLYLPFFALGHVLAVHVGQPADGYSWPYSFFLLLGTLCYSIAGVWTLRSVLRRHFTDSVVAATLVGIVVGTNLLFYSIQNAMPHAYNFFLITAFLRLCMAWYEKPSLSSVVLLGLVMGLIVLVRPVNAVVLLLFPLYGMTGPQSLGERFAEYRRNGRALALVMLSAVAVLAVQVLYWKHATGHWLVWSYGGERFFWDRPHIVQGLFGFRKGLFLYVPLTLFALVGLTLLPRRAPVWGWWPAVVTIVFMYVTSCWWCWWYGGGLSIRPLVDMYGVWALGLAALLAWLHDRGRVLRVAALATLSLAGAYGTWVDYQCLRGIIHHDGMNYAAWRHIQFRGDIGQVRELITRPDYERAYHYGDVER